MSLLRNIHSTKELVLHASIDDARELGATIDLIVGRTGFEYSLLVNAISAAIHSNPILSVRLECLQDATKAKLGMVLKCNHLGIWDTKNEKFFEFPLPHEVVRSSAADAARALTRLCTEYVGMPVGQQRVHQEECHGRNHGKHEDLRTAAPPGPIRATGG